MRGHSPVHPYGNASLTVTATFTTIATGGTRLTGQYRAEYYNNSSPAGSPAFSRCETSITYELGAAGPGSLGSAPVDFSVRWTGRSNFAAGSHSVHGTRR